MNIDYDLLTIAWQAPLVERQFAARSYRGMHAGPGVIHTRRNTPIMPSSPYATYYLREGQSRLADMSPGTPAIQPTGLVGASAFSNAHTTGEDPHDDTDGQSTRQAPSLVTGPHAGFVLDLHGMSQVRPVAVAAGMACGVTPGGRPAPLTTFIDTFKKASFDNVARDGLLPAARPTTIASFTWRTCKVPAIPLEIPPPVPSCPRSCARRCTHFNTGL